MRDGQPLVVENWARRRVALQSAYACWSAMSAVSVPRENCPRIRNRVPNGGVSETSPGHRGLSCARATPQGQSALAPSAMNISEHIPEADQPPNRDFFWKCSQTPALMVITVLMARKQHPASPEMT